MRDTFRLGGMTDGVIAGQCYFRAGGSAPQRRPDQAKADEGTDGRGADQETKRNAMKTMTIGALSLVALADGAVALHAQALQNNPTYSGPAVLLASEDHAERLLPGNPASRALDLSIWQEEEIAAIRLRQRREIADLRADTSLDSGERHFLVADAVRRGGKDVVAMLTQEQRETLLGWVRQEIARVNMILGEDLVGRLLPFSSLAERLSVSDDQLEAVARIRDRQRGDLAALDAETGADDFPDEIKDRQNAILLRHGEAARAVLTASQNALLDEMWSERY